jgi:hypothetical protein
MKNNYQKYKKFIQLLSEYRMNQNGETKLKVYNESYRLLKLGFCGHLGIN